MIESKSDSDHGSLDFVIQYPKGQAQELVRNCQHQGYQITIND